VRFAMQRGREWRRSFAGRHRRHAERTVGRTGTDAQQTLVFLITSSRTCMRHHGARLDNNIDVSVFSYANDVALPAFARRRCSNRSTSARRAHSSKPAADGRTPYRLTDPGLHTMQIITQVYWAGLAANLNV